VLFTHRYSLGGSTEPAPLQLDNAKAKHGEVILQGATSPIYLGDSFDSCLSAQLRYSLPLGVESRLKISNLNLIWAFATATSSTSLDAILEVGDKLEGIPSATTK
jgi:hypothetical protein